MYNQPKDKSYNKDRKKEREIKKMSNYYNADDFDREILRNRKRNTRNSLETSFAWRYNDEGSTSVHSASMGAIMEAYNEYRTSNYWG